MREEHDIVLLTLDDKKAIRAFKFEYLSGNEIGIRAACEGGRWHEYKKTAAPTFFDFYNNDTDISGGDIKSLRAEIIRISGWPNEGYALWAEYDEQGEIDPATDTDERFQKWLSKKVCGEFVEQWMERVSGSVSEFAPGFDLLGRLSRKEALELGIRKGDLAWGPGHSVPCVIAECGAKALKLYLSKKGLPFLLR